MSKFDISCRNCNCKVRVEVLYDANREVLARNLFCPVCGSAYTMAVPTKPAFSKPINVKPSNDITKSPGAFGSNRSGGRRHAGVDLYCDEGTPVYAMEDGVITAFSPEYYAGTQAVAITGSVVIRYCEMQVNPGFAKVGTSVKQGACLGIVKKCEGINQAMLHIEFFNNIISKAALTDVSKLPYKRREDLFDGTEILKSVMEG